MGIRASVRSDQPSADGAGCNLVGRSRAGRKLGFASCFLMVGDKVVARANGTFSPVGG